MELILDMVKPYAIDRLADIEQSILEVRYGTNSGYDKA